MNFTNAELFNGVKVLLGSIALVLLEIILRKLAMIHFHDPVAGYFGDN